MTGEGVRRLAGAAGMVSVGVMLLGWLLVPGNPPGPAATAELVVRWTLEDRRTLLVGTVLVAGGAALSVVFFAGVRALCARAEGAPGILATVGWGAMLVSIAISLVGVGLAQAQAFLVLDGDPGTVEAFHDARLLLVDLAGLPAAVGFLAFGAAMVRTGFPARWLGWAAGVAAAAEAAGVIALSRDGFFSPSGGAPRLAAAGFVVWVAAVSVVLLAPRRPA